MLNIRNLNKNLHLLVLILVFLIILIKNFPFSSWYTGWDNLHPEFDFGLNFKRAFSSVWQTNQGLGTYGGHGYAASLPHTIILFLISFIIPKMYLRAGFTFLMLLTGIVGVFFLLRKIFTDKEEGIKNKAALFGGLFYLLNLATVQAFYIQLEAFIIHFAALPWLVLSMINVLENTNRRRLLIFAILSFVASGQGFIPPLFFSYLIVLLIFLLTYCLINFSSSKLKKAVMILFVVFAVNAYWLLPAGYYSLTRSSTYINSYNNINSTADFILKNQKYGDLKNLALLKGFIFESIDSNTQGKTVYIFDQWNKHLDHWYIAFLGYLFFGIIIAGLLRLFFMKSTSNYLTVGVVIGFMVIFSLLAMNVFPFSFITKLLQLVPVFRQAFRVAFTKFSISLAFFYSLGFGAGILLILEGQKNLTRKIITLIVFVTLLLFAFPSLSGEFLYKRTKLNIPSNYFDLFTFFKKQDKQTRIANLPIGWHWGWSVYQWGYSGSGFLWYGIEQPIMDRSFDVWSQYNENYYWEISYAVYSENFPLFEKVLQKYKINWLIFDKNVVPYPNVKGFLYSDKLEDYLDTNTNFTLITTLKDQNKKVKDIKIYQIKNTYEAKDFQYIFGNNSLKNVGPLYSFTDFDQAYNDFGDYYTELKNNYDVYYPTRSLFTSRGTNEVSISIINGLLKNQAQPSYESTKDPFFLNHQAANCGITNIISSVFKQHGTNEKNLRFNSKNSENCYSIKLNQMEQKLAYLIEIESRNIIGGPLRFALVNHDSKKADIEIFLNTNNKFATTYLIIPPMKQYGLGYTLNFNNISIGNEETINELKRISIFPIPYNNLISQKTVGNKNINQDRQIISYFQAYDPGWKAYVVQRSASNVKRFLTNIFPFIFGKELKDSASAQGYGETRHVLVNNWANGWVISQKLVSNQSETSLRLVSDKSQTIYILFWPQYLQYLGFVLLILSFLLILRLPDQTES